MFSRLSKTEVGVWNIIRCCVSMKLICGLVLASWVMLSVLPLQANAQPDLVTDPSSPPPWHCGHEEVGVERCGNWFRIFNQGDQTATVNSMTISGINADDFRTETGDLPFSVDPQHGRHIEICFQPSGLGLRSATLSFYDDEDPANLLLEVSLEGEGVEPEIAVDPDPRPGPWDFGNVEVWNDEDRWLRIYNPGHLDVDVTWTTFTGGGDFWIDDWGHGHSYTLSPGDDNNIRIRFRPSSPGSKSATLSIYNTSSDNPLSIELQGQGAVPDIDVDPDTWNFGMMEVETTHYGFFLEKKFVVENTGDAWLNVWSVDLEDNEDDFWFEYGHHDFDLDPGQTHEIVIRFAPREEGTRTATLRLRNNVPGEDPVDVPLQGEGFRLSWSIWLHTYIPGNPDIPSGIIGAHPDGTGGYDVGLDTPYPSPPPDEALDAYFELSDPNFPEFTRLARDCRYNEDYGSFYEEWIFHARLDSTEQDRFGIWCDLGNFPGPEELNATITQLEPEEKPPVNMRYEGGLGEDFQEGVDYKFKIVVKQRVAVRLELFEGWNMVSCSGEPLDPSISNLINGTPVDAVYTWDPDHSPEPDYIVPATLDFGTAYWFHTTEDYWLNIPECLLHKSLTRSVEKGWNMVGSVCEHVPVSRVKSSPVGAVLRTVYRWDHDSQRYELVNTIKPEGAIKPQEGYWMGAIEEPATVTIDNTVLAPPAAETQPIVRRPSWESIIAAQTRGQNRELVFGMHPSASGGFDSLLDRPHPPLPVWADEGLNASWMVDDAIFSSLDESFVADSSRAIWELSVKLPESGELQWRNLPTEYRCLLWYDGQVIRMQDETAMSLPPGSHKLRLVLDSFESLPDRTELLSNYPNPANPETWIPYRLAEDGDVTLVIYDTSGREIRRFHLYNQFAGEYKDKRHAIYWDGRNQSGEAVSSGVYFYSLQTAGVSSQTGKLVIIR